MPKEVEALRTSLDSRLTALEKALADPKQHSSLETLILDLARIATEEADATARQAVLDAQKAGQDAAAAARTDAAAALEAEKTESVALREVIDQAKAALKQAEAALKDERRTAEAANREVAGAHRELAAIRESLEQQQTASVSQRRELDAALAAVEAERVRAAAIEQQVAQARAEEESERTKLAAELAQERAALESERAAAGQLLQTSSELEQHLATARTELSAVRTERDEARRDIDTVRGGLDSTRGERDAATRDLEAARRELDGIRQDADTRTQTLSRSQAEQELALKTAQDGARSAEARLEQAMRERDAAQNDATELKRQLDAAEGAIRERDALKRELQAAHEARDAADVLDAVRSIEPDTEIDGDSETVVDLTSISKEEERQLVIENRIRALELALRDAETRAESAELELDLQRRLAPAAKHAKPVEPPSAEPAPAPVSEVTDGSTAEQFRGPARAAKRVQFKGETDIQVDGTPGKLVDLSLTGAQLLTATAMKPNRLIKVTLPMGDSSIACKAKVMWSRLEPRSGQLWYRAGVSFTSADQIALETFLGVHQKP